MKTRLKGPKGRFFFGSAADFKRDQLGFYESCAREYGDFVQTRLGPVRMLLIYHPDAIEELLALYGDQAKGCEPRIIPIRTGRVRNAWVKNCVALGLAGGFIEPLEATALLFIQRTATTFVEFLEAGDLGDAAHDRFNQRVNDHFEGTRDYIVTHYKTNTRRDTDYWRANAENTNLSDSLRQLYGLWMSGRSIAKDVGRQAIGKGYPVFSWYCIMSGMGIFPIRRTCAPTQRQKIATVWKRSTTYCREAR